MTKITVPVEEWALIGTLMYHDADERGRGNIPLAHDGRGVMTWWDYAMSSKESWAPPADEYRCVFDPELKQWMLYVRPEAVK